MRIVPLLMLVFIAFALGFGELMIAGILPAIATGLGCSIPLTGQLVTVYALTFAALAAPLTIALRRIPARGLLTASLLVVAAANAFAANAPDFALLCTARVLAAAGSALASPLALAAVDRVTTADFRGRAHGIVFSGFSLAAMLGVPLGALIAARAGWRWTFASVALFAAAAALGALTIPAPESEPRDPSGWRRALAHRPIVRGLVVSLVFLTAQYTAFTYFRPLFAASSGAGIAAIVWLLFLYGGAGIGGNVCGGIAVDRFGTRAAVLAAIGGCTVCLGLLPVLARSLPGASVVVAAWASTSWAFSPAANRQLSAAAGAAADIALALNLTAFNVGIAAGSALGGLTIAVIGLSGLAPVAAALCGIAWLTARGQPRAA